MGRHLIAEADAAIGNTVREYVWLADMPISVVADVDTASPILYYVHVDHLNRPVMMTDGLKAPVWEAVWLPYGAAHSITGAAANDARFPGQWFQIETGLHYNWHRHYDPTLARYTQADPLGFVDGPSVFAYAINSPLVRIDRDGRAVFGLGDSIDRLKKRFKDLFGGDRSCPAPDDEDDCGESQKELEAEKNMIIEGAKRLPEAENIRHINAVQIPFLNLRIAVHNQECPDENHVDPLDLFPLGPRSFQ